MSRCDLNNYKKGFRNKKWIQDLFVIVEFHIRGAHIPTDLNSMTSLMTPESVLRDKPNAGYQI